VHRVNGAVRRALRDFTEWGLRGESAALGRTPSALETTTRGVPRPYQRRPPKKLHASSDARRRKTSALRDARLCSRRFRKIMIAAMSFSALRRLVLALALVAPAACGPGEILGGDDEGDGGTSGSSSTGGGPPIEDCPGLFCVDCASGEVAPAICKGGKLCPDGFVFTCGGSGGYAGGGNGGSGGSGGSSGSGGSGGNAGAGGVIDDGGAGAAGAAGSDPEGGAGAAGQPADAGTD
jgi:hypothetical protein